MTIRCGACGRAITVPDERASNPRLKVKCTCGSVFALSDAARATPAAGAPARPAPPVTPPIPASSPTAAARPPAQAAPPARPAASPAMPRPQAPARTAAATASAAVAGAIAAGQPVVAPAAIRPGAWRRCTNHPQQRAESLCTACMIGYCSACVKLVQNVAICAACDGLCTPMAKYEEGLRQDAQRQRSLLDDLGLILGYPFVDPMAYVMLAIFTGVFGLMAKYSPVGGGGGILLSQGVLYWYCFSSLSRVAIGNTTHIMPEFRDIDDIAKPLRLGFAAFVASSLPLILLLLVGGLEAAGTFLTSNPVPDTAVVRAQDEEAAAGDVDQEEPAEEPEAAAGQEKAGTPPGARHEAAEGEGRSGHGTPMMLLLVLGVLWKLVYTPVALIVAGLSRSMLSTLNPLIGVDSIRRMGLVYWQAIAIYTGLVLVQWTLTFVLRLLPVAGDLIGAFVDAYVYLCIGCCLGLAVFKKAKELAWD